MKVDREPCLTTRRHIIDSILIRFSRLELPLHCDTKCVPTLLLRTWKSTRVNLGYRGNVESKILHMHSSHGRKDPPKTALLFSSRGNKSFVGKRKLEIIVFVKRQLTIAFTSSPASGREFFTGHSSILIITDRPHFRPLPTSRGVGGVIQQLDGTGKHLQTMTPLSSGNCH